MIPMGRGFMILMKGIHDADRKEGTHDTDIQSTSPEDSEQRPLESVVQEEEKQ